MLYSDISLAGYLKIIHHGIYTEMNETAYSAILYGMKEWGNPLLEGTKRFCQIKETTLLKTKYADVGQIRDTVPERVAVA